MILALLSALSVNCKYVGILIYEKVSIILDHWGSSIDEKYEMILGDYYKFIKDNTPPKSKILFPPPRRRYRPLGCNWQHSFFLYPREISWEPSPLKNIPPVDSIVIYRDFPGCVVNGDKIGYHDIVGLYKLKHESKSSN